MGFCLRMVSSILPHIPALRKTSHLYSICLICSSIVFASGESFLGILACTTTYKSPIFPRTLFPRPAMRKRVPGFVHSGTLSVSRLPSGASMFSLVHKRKSTKGIVACFVMSKLSASGAF